MIDSRKPSKQMVEKLIETNHIKNKFHTILEKGMHSMIEKIDLEKRSTSISKEEILEILDGEIKNTQVSDLLYDVYCKYFTASEVMDLIAFYKSPAGKKLLDNTDGILQDVSTQYETIVIKILTKVSQEVKKRVDERE